MADGYKVSLDDDVSEAETVDRARSGDPSAMGILLHNYDPRMRAVAWGIVNDRHLMEDALQDAYLRACRSIHRFRGEAAFSSWLYRIVTNSCVDTLRRTNQRRELLLPQQELQSPEQRYPVIEYQTIEVAVRDLPPKQRAALLLVDCEGYSYREVAEMFGTSTGTVGSWLSRARACLRTSGALHV